MSRIFDAQVALLHAFKQLRRSNSRSSATATAARQKLHRRHPGTWTLADRPFRTQTAQIFDPPVALLLLYLLTQLRVVSTTRTRSSATATAAGCRCAVAPKRSNDAAMSRSRGEAVR